MNKLLSLFSSNCLLLLLIFRKNQLNLTPLFRQTLKTFESKGPSVCSNRGSSYDECCSHLQVCVNGRFQSNDQVFLNFGNLNNLLNNSKRSTCSIVGASPDCLACKRLSGEESAPVRCVSEHSREPRASVHNVYSSRANRK